MADLRCRIYAAVSLCTRYLCSRGGLPALCREKWAANPAFYDGLIQALDILAEVCLRYGEEILVYGDIYSRSYDR